MFTRSSRRQNRRGATAKIGSGTLLASPTFASWRQGVTLDVGEWMRTDTGRAQATIVSVAHLDDEERVATQNPMDLD